MTHHVLSTKSNITTMTNESPSSSSSSSSSSSTTTSAQQQGRKVRRSQSSSFIFSTTDPSIANKASITNYRKPSLPIVTHLKSSNKSDDQQQQQQRMRTSTSARFGKSLLPAWLGRQQQQQQQHPAGTLSSSSSVSSVHSASTPITSANHHHQFESMLDELEMKDDHKEQLRQLPTEQQAYLLQQNTHIKNKQSSTSQQQHVTSSSSASRNNSHPNQSSSSSSVSASTSSAAPPTSPSSSAKVGKPTSPKSNTSSLPPTQRPSKQRSLMKPVSSSTRSIFSSHLRKNASSNSSNSSSSSSASQTSTPPPPPAAPSSTSGMSTASSPPLPPPLPSETTTTLRQATSPEPTASSSTATTMTIDKRAANYKFRRNNMKHATHANSRVGSMILEFNALAQHETEQEDESVSAWLLLDSNNNQAAATAAAAAAALTNASSTPSSTSTSPPQAIDPFMHHHLKTELRSSTSIDRLRNNNNNNNNNSSSSSSRNHGATIHHSLSRKEASHLASLMNLDFNARNPRERNSPYIYVERLRSRNTSFDVLLKHLQSLQSSLEIESSSLSSSWINEFLSRRHDGFSALEYVLERLNTKKKKKKNVKANDVEDLCLLQTVQCLLLLVKKDVGLQQVVMRPSILHQLLVSLFAALTTLLSFHGHPLSQQQEQQRQQQEISTYIFGKSPSLSSIGSHLLPSFSTSTLQPTSETTKKADGSHSNSNNSSSKGPATSTLFKLCCHIFEVLVLCSTSTAYDTLLQVLSNIRGEQYRFERMIQYLSSFRLDQMAVDVLVWECQAMAVSFFNAIVHGAENMEARCALRTELDRRGLNDHFKMLRSSQSIPQLVEDQIKNYLDEKKTDLDVVRKVENVKRQSVWNHSDDIILTALKSLNGDPEMYYTVVDTLWELLKVGQEKLQTDKSLAMDIWSIVKSLANTMSSAQSNCDFQPLVLQFLQSTQPIVGKLPIDMLIEGKCVDESEKTTTCNALTDTNKKVSESLEDMEGLRNMVEELKDALLTTEESMTKIRREKNDLAMKVKERDSKIVAMQKEHDRELASLQQGHHPTGPGKDSDHVQQPQKENENNKKEWEEQPSSPLSPTPLSTKSSPSIVTVRSSTSSLPPCPTLPPPPPPPPPPPIPPSVDPACVARRRNTRRRSASRSSKYLHPLALNLCFPSLKSLHENAVTSPTSPTSGTGNSTAAITDVSSAVAIATAPSAAAAAAMIPPPPPLLPANVTNLSCLQQMTSITMKQFFWSKLPQERIQNTVWKEIIPLSKEERPAAKTIEVTPEEDVTTATTESSDATSSSVELDTVELERLFKKTQGSRQQTSASSPKILRKQNLKTLLEFNRANNIAIMLARIKLSYPEIRDAIWNIDDNRLTIDNLMAIRQYIPSKEEIEIIQEYDGDIDMLGNAERYFKAIMYIPRLADRIGCMIFRRKFHYELQEILPELDTLQYAIDELRHSHRFKIVLKTILAIGNYLNGHTIRGNAYGFHLDALLKMRDTKAEGEGVSNLPTLLHYLVYFLSKTGQDVVNFREDVVHLEAAAKLSPPALFASVNALNAHLGQIRDELTMHQRKRMSALQIDRFTEAMEEFLIEAEPIVDNVKTMTRNIEDQLKELIMYYGEDPALVKSEDFFSIIHTFASSFEKAKVEIQEARERALRRQRQQQDLLLKKKSMDLMASPSLSTSSTLTYSNHSRSTSYGDLSGIPGGERPLTPSTTHSSILSSINNSSNNNNNSSTSSGGSTGSGQLQEDDEGFDQVLKDLRAGLKHGDHSWRVKQLKKRKSKMQQPQQHHHLHHHHYHCDEAIKGPHQDTPSTTAPVLV